MHSPLSTCSVYMRVWLSECNLFNNRGEGSLVGVGVKMGRGLGGAHPGACALFPKPAEVMGVLGIMRVGQYQAVKAFGDKPWLMTRKSVVALICAGPLANWRKAVNYTKETPNLLRNMLNIPPLLGGWGETKQCSIFLVFLSKPNLKACIPIFLVLVFREYPQRT